MANETLLEPEQQEGFSGSPVVFLGTQKIRLGPIGVGASFDGLVILGHPANAKPIGTLTQDQQLVLLSVSNGLLKQVYAYQGDGQVSRLTGTLAAQSKYRIGWVAGKPNSLLKNLDYLNLSLRSLSRTVDLSGQASVADLLPLSVKTKLGTDVSPVIASTSPVQPALALANVPTEYVAPTAAIAATQPGLDLEPIRGDGSITLLATNDPYVLLATDNSQKVFRVKGDV